MTRQTGANAPTSHPANDLQDYVDRFEGRLSAADKKIIRVLTGEPMSGAMLTARETAAAAGVHPASVVRLVQKLGFAGFADFKAFARGYFLNQENPSLRVRSSLTQDAEKSILQSLVEREAALLLELPKWIEQTAIDRTVAMIRAARRCVVLGHGHGSDLASLFARRLMRSGYDARALGHSDWQLCDALTLCGEGDLAILIVMREAPPGIGNVVTEIQARGCRVVALGDLNALTLEPEPDLSLGAPRGPGQKSQTLTAPMAIVNTLILELARQDDGASLAALDRLSSLKKALVK